MMQRVAPANPPPPGIIDPEYSKHQGLGVDSIDLLLRICSKYLHVYDSGNKKVYWSRVQSIFAWLTANSFQNVSVKAVFKNTLKDHAAGLRWYSDIRPSYATRARRDIDHILNELISAPSDGARTSQSSEHENSRLSSAAINGIRLVSSY